MHSEVYNVAIALIICMSFHNHIKNAECKQIINHTDMLKAIWTK